MLNLANPASMLALPESNKLLVLSEHCLYAYALDGVARAAAGAATTEQLEAGRQLVAGLDGGVLFFRAGRVGSRNMSACSLSSLSLVPLDGHVVDGVADGVLGG